MIDIIDMKYTNISLMIDVEVTITTLYQNLFELFFYKKFDTLLNIFLQNLNHGLVFSFI